MRALMFCLSLVLLAANVFAREVTPPKWIVDAVRDAGVFDRPGIHVLDGGKLLVIGEGRVSSSLGEARALRLARSLAEGDARRRLADYLFPNERGLVALEISGQETVLEKHRDGAAGRILLGIVVDPAQVERVTQTSAMVFAECRNLRLHPQVMDEMATIPTLLDGGGHIFESPDGWLAVGVGFAEVKTPGDSVSEREARKIARVNAAKELSELVFGAWIQVMEADGSAYAESGAGGHFLDWSIKRTRESVAGEFANMEEAGTWFTDDGEFAMVVTLSDPRLTWDAVDQLRFAPTVSGLDMAAEWEEVFHRRPQWWFGGAGLAAVDGEAVAVAIGAAKLKDDRAYDAIQAPMAAEMDARRNFLKFFSGFSTMTVTEDVEVIREIFSDAGESTELLHTLQKTSAEKARGAVRTMEKVGTWKSEDGKILYAAFRLNLNALQK